MILINFDNCYAKYRSDKMQFTYGSLYWMQILISFQEVRLIKSNNTEAKKEREHSFWLGVFVLVYDMNLRPQKPPSILPAKSSQSVPTN